MTDATITYTDDRTLPRDASVCSPLVSFLVFVAGCL